MAGNFDNLKRDYVTFLQKDEHQEKYTGQIRQALEGGNYRVIVNINDIRAFHNGSTIVRNLMQSPRENLLALQGAAMDTAREQDAASEKKLARKEIQIGIEGSFGSHSVSPRGLSSRFLNKMVEVEGIVVKCSSVRPKLVESVQYCSETKQHTIRTYRDATSMNIGIATRDNQELLPTNAAMPSVDSEGNPLELEHGLCVYKDYQTLVLQEMPEKSRVGQLPRSVDVILEHDLVDHCKPGDRILCTGVYRALPSQMNGQTNGVFKTVLICNNVSIIGKEVGAVKLTATDVRNIR
jgi:DNA replication licensing factor MCM3